MWFDPASEYDGLSGEINGFPVQARNAFRDQALKWRAVGYPGEVQLVDTLAEATVHVAWTRVPGAPGETFGGRMLPAESALGGGRQFTSYELQLREKRFPGLDRSRFGVLFNSYPGLPSALEYPTNPAGQNNYFRFLSLHEAGHLVGLENAMEGCTLDHTVMVEAPMPPGGYPDNLTQIDIAALRKIHPQ
jgi:hypothetical protein